MSKARFGGNRTGMLVACCALALAAGLLSNGVFRAAVAAGEPGRFTALCAKQFDIVISHRGEDYLQLTPIAWGPRWAWAELRGSTKSEEGQTVGTLFAHIAGADKPVEISVRAARPAPNRLQIDYTLHAEVETPLTCIVVALTPGKTFDGRDAIVSSEGGATRVRCPFQRTGLGTQVTSIQLTGADGGTTRLQIDPPCDVAADGSARIVLAKGKLSAGETRRVAIRIELPGPSDWYPSAAEVPDEPGFETWYPWRAKGDTGPSEIGMDDWLDRPAGKHGRILRQADKLIYHERPIKLWGLNLCYGTCAPPKPLAEHRAAFYRKYGVNAVRLHKYADGPDWAGIQSPRSFVQFDAAGLDRMDYQLAKFKEAGIYVTLSPTFGTQKLGSEDRAQVPFLEEFGSFGAGRAPRIETPHSAIYYASELQQLQILQMVNLLKHRNPYTGLTYAEEPALAFIEILNEQSVLFYSSTAPLKASPTLRKRVGARFSAWLREKYGNQENLLKAWGGRRALDGFANDGFPAGEQLDKDNILPLGNPWYWDPDQLKGSQAYRKRRLLDSLEFLYGLECEFYDRYVKALRENGYRGEVVGSNWQAGRAYSHFANLHADYRVGTIDRHNYFGGGRANASMLARAGSGMLSAGMQQVQDRPFMLSEWIHVFPNEFAAEGPAVLGAYGMGLQGWDASFVFQNRDAGVFNERLGTDQWEVATPQVLGVFPAVARHVYRGDIQESEQVAVRNVHVPSLFEGKLSFDDSVKQDGDSKELTGNKVSARALAVARSVISFTQDYTDTPAFDLSPYEKDGGLVAATGRLRWTEATDTHGGCFTLDTPATKAAVGFTQGRKCNLGNVTIQPQSPFSAVYLTATKPGETIESSRHLLIVAMARARNTGMKFSPDGARLLATGKGPIRIEPVKARITVKKQGQPTLVLLDHDGRRTNTTIAIQDGDFLIDGARDKTPYYLLQY